MVQLNHSTLNSRKCFSTDEIQTTIVNISIQMVQCMNMALTHVSSRDIIILYYETLREQAIIQEWIECEF